MKAQQKGQDQQSWGRSQGPAAMLTFIASDPDSDPPRAALILPTKKLRS